MEENTPKRNRISIRDEEEKKPEMKLSKLFGSIVVCWKQGNKCSQCNAKDVCFREVRKEFLEIIDSQVTYGN